MGKRLNLKAFRAKQGLTQVQMAKICKVGLSTYCFMESGKIDGKLKAWDALKDHYKLTGDEICNLQEKQQTQES
jgi:DNA-binding XRE family transcriptional regulator